VREACAKEARIVNVIQAAERPMLTQEVCDAAKVCRTSACRILNTMALLGVVLGAAPGLDVAGAGLAGLVGGAVDG
jgi:DNA-binding IclR family transcriptional regulator